MTVHTRDFLDWPFPDPISTATFCTDKVASEDFDVLQVSHDFNGDWQFLDGTTDEPGECVMLCLGCIFEKHADMAAIANLPRGWGACRDVAGAEWERWELDPEDDQDDGAEDEPHKCGGPEADAKALANIEEYGLHVINVMEDDENAPFSYSIGIERSLGMPELIVIGLKSDVAHSAINECYRQMKEDGAMTPGARVAGLLGGGFECLIGEASSEKVADYMHWQGGCTRASRFAPIRSSGRAPPECSHGNRALATGSSTASPCWPDSVTNAAIRCTRGAFADAWRRAERTFVQAWAEPTDIIRR